MDDSIWINELYDHWLIKLFRLIKSVNEIIFYNEVDFDSDYLYTFNSIKKDKELKIIEHYYSQFNNDKIVHANIWLWRAKVLKK